MCLINLNIDVHTHVHPCPYSCMYIYVRLHTLINMLRYMYGVAQNDDCPPTWVILPKILESRAIAQIKSGFIANLSMQ